MERNLTMASNYERDSTAQYEANKLAVELVEKKIIVEEDQKLEEPTFPIYQPKIRVPSSQGIPLSKFRKQT